MLVPSRCSQLICCFQLGFAQPAEKDFLKLMTAYSCKSAASADQLPPVLRGLFDFVLSTSKLRLKELAVLPSFVASVNVDQAACCHALHVFELVRESTVRKSYHLSLNLCKVWFGHIVGIKFKFQLGQQRRRLALVCCHVVAIMDYGRQATWNI